MPVADVMTPDPMCCSTDTTAQEAAAMMAENDCGCLPVVDEDDRVVGVVTDRDIACRCVAEGKDPHTPVSDIMTSQARCCGPDDDAEQAMSVMSDAQIRRVPVVDETGCCVGMVSQADIARKLNNEAGQVVVERISQPTASSSATDTAPASSDRAG